MVAKKTTIKTIAYLSNTSFSIGLYLIQRATGTNASNGMKYLKLKPRLNWPMKAHVNSWIKHVATYIMSIKPNEPSLVFSSNLSFCG